LLYIAHHKKIASDFDDEAGKAPIIIALSAHITEEDYRLGKEAGFDDFRNISNL